MAFRPVALARHILGKPPVPVQAAAAEECVDAAPSGCAETVEAVIARHAETAPVYQNFARVLDYGVKAPSKGGVFAKFQLTDPDDPFVHPFKGLRCAKHAGHRLRVVISQPQPEGEDLTLFVGEASLTWWSDDCTNGMRVTVRLDDGGPDTVPQHPLTGVEPGNNGDAVFLVCWAIDNEETPEDPRDARRAARPFATMTAVQQSNIKCRRDAQFQRWCAAEAAALLPPGTELPPFEEGPAAFAERVVRAYCGVDSRRVMNQDTAEGFAARQRWNDLLRRFDDWRHSPAWEGHAVDGGFGHGG